MHPPALFRALLACLPFLLAPGSVPASWEMDSVAGAIAARLQDPAPFPSQGKDPDPLLAQIAAALREVYLERGHRPLWIDADGHPGTAARALIAAFSTSRRRGLDPRDYGMPGWTDRLEMLGAASTAAQRAAWDLDLSRQAMRLAWHLQRGRVDPRKLDFEMPQWPRDPDLATILLSLADSADSDALLDGLEPAFAGYRRLRAMLAHYLDLAGQQDQAGLPPLQAKVLEPGNSWDGVPALAKWLGHLGDLADADLATASAGSTYDAALVAAVESFQERHGLLVDGRIGKQTLQALATPLSTRIEQISLSLERWRWVPGEFAQPPIVVNIPEFALRAVDEQNKVALRSKVVVGMAFRRQTPVFVGEMRSVVFRPWWHVPTSIVRRDLLPRAIKDPGYFREHGYELVGSDSQVVDAERIEALRRGRIGLRQKPGKGNALGLVKFLFPNDHSVYLHDTPATGLFARARRDLSSGCVRVENPAELAAWVLRNQAQWTLEAVRHAMEKGPDNRSVAVDPPIPVYLVYVTAMVPEKGQVRFLDDIYGHDAKLAQALARRG